MSAARKIQELKVELDNKEKDNIIYLENYKKVEVKLNWRGTIYTFIAILFFLGVCIIYLKASFALISLNTQYNSLKSTYEKILQENERFELSMQKNGDLETVYKRAIEIGMRSPETNEVHMIKQKIGKSYTIILNKKNDIIQKERNRFFEFFKFLKYIVLH